MYCDGKEKILIKSTNNTEYALQGSVISFFFDQNICCGNGVYNLFGDIDWVHADKASCIEELSPNSFLIKEKNFEFDISFDVKYKQTHRHFKYRAIPQKKEVNNYLILVNKFACLDESYVSELGYCFGKRMSPVIIPDLCNLFKEALSNNCYIYLDSAYRFFETQKNIYDNYVKKYGENQKYAAKPGESEHQTGLCVDILWYKPLSIEEHIKTKEFMWLKENCIRFGFILRYPRGGGIYNKI